MTDPMDYREAAAQADAKKALFLANFSLARERVSPARLKADAKAGIRNAANSSVDKTKRTVRQHPVLATFASVGLFAFVFRRPLCALLGWAKTRLRTSTDDAATTDVNLASANSDTQPQPEISDEKRY